MHTTKNKIDASGPSPHPSTQFVNARKNVAVIVRHHIQLVNSVNDDDDNVLSEIRERGGNRRQ